ncbi:uncharacterized protein Triagg1_624 [Trichoderma aggressivum f. europaeum]|uniref:Nucleoside phosphorylase domain-containing protein n=1 Tax=Trichoderma aggressivum f. europaeum TaxID=173218 RepID=A0AAE1INN2_9HYPO|nr:hypothetical protein Triagg1_624 [Trichoderma aggressivum f. europaeum]
MSLNLTIRERAATCVDLFSQAILLLARTGSSDDQNGLLDEFGRFKLWASNIGIFADLHSSLDYRLRDFNDIKDSFTRQLITTESRLQQLLDAAQRDPAKPPIKGDEDEEPGISEPSKPTTATMFQDWNNTQLLQSIHQSIDWLHRLSNLVRKASFANQHKRADKFILKDDDDNDMSDTLTDYYTKLIKREFSGMQDTMVQRLAASMLVRRRRIMYRRSQQQRWKMPQVEPKTKNLHLVTPSTKLGPIPLEPSVPFKNEKAPMSKPEATAPSRLTATTIDKNIRQRVSAPSGISRGSTAPLNEQSMLLVPPPPKGIDLGEDFVCDYCCLILPSKIALNRNAWADHVNKDLCPYVCVVDKCDDAIEIHSSRKEWLAHMSTRHQMRWYCIVKSHIQPLEFDSENGFIEHMRIEHPGKFRNDQLSLVAENSSRPKDSVFDDCPFCIGTSDNFEEHVGLHLRDLALRSLPWPDDDERYSQSGKYLHSDNSISNEDARSTILDFKSDSTESDIADNTDDGGGSEHDAEERLDLYGHFQEIADQHKPIDLREQLSDKTLISLAIQEYRDFPQLVNKLEDLLDNEYSQAKDITAIEEAVVFVQQLTNTTSLDYEKQKEPTIRALADPDRTVPPGSTQSPRRVFEIAIICTLLIEYDAICLIFDEIWDKDYRQNKGDENTYTTGRVGKRNVVLAVLPHTRKTTAAAAIANFRMMYLHLDLFLLVGICGGVPKFHSGKEEMEILLGDIIISSRVVEHYPNSTNKFIGTNTLRTNHRGRANEAARTLHEFSETRGIFLQLVVRRSLLNLQSKEIASWKGRNRAESKYQYPGNANDYLFEADYFHKHHAAASNCRLCNGNHDACCNDARKASCQEIGCEKSQLVTRQKKIRDFQSPMVRFGAIASGGTVVTNGLERDKISNQQRVIAFDMEGFGAWEKVPCIFIKSVCDYADGHKEESWRNFAAAAAAAATRVFLLDGHKHERWV